MPTPRKEYQHIATSENQFQVQMTFEKVYKPRHIVRMCKYTRWDDVNDDKAAEVVLVSAM